MLLVSSLSRHQRQGGAHIVGTTEKQAALAKLAHAEAKVTAEKEGTFQKTAAGIGQEDTSHKPLSERVQRLEDMVRRLAELHAAEAALLREWAKAEISHLESD